MVTNTIIDGNSQLIFFHSLAISIFLVEKIAVIAIDQCVSSNIISSWDFPRVSGTKNIPKMAFSMHAIPNINIQAESPKVFRQNGKRYPLKNMKINPDDVIIARDISQWIIFSQTLPIQSELPLLGIVQLIKYWVLASNQADWKKWCWLNIVVVSICVHHVQATTNSRWQTKIDSEPLKLRQLCKESVWNHKKINSAKQTNLNHSLYYSQVYLSIDAFHNA